jgi:hypothetical protein
MKSHPNDPRTDFPIESLDEFQERFPDAHWLEDRTIQGHAYQRWSNGQEEGSSYESTWFCAACGLLVEDIHTVGCADCAAEEDSAWEALA